MTLNTKIVRFIVNVKIKYDTENDLKEAIKHVKNGVGFETISAGEHNYHAKMMCPRAQKEEKQKRIRIMPKKEEKMILYKKSMELVEQCQKTL